MALPVSHCGKSILQEAYKSLGAGYRIRGNVREVNAEEASEEEGRAGVGMKVKLHFGCLEVILSGCFREPDRRRRTGNSRN
jgi:hypothetical protein